MTVLPCPSSAPRPTDVNARIRAAADALHAAQVRHQSTCLITVPCIDDAALAQILIAVAASCGPCFGPPPRS